MMLAAGRENARHKLQAALPGYAAGTHAAAHHPHAMAALYRQLGVCSLLTGGVAEPLQLALMQAASAYLFRLPAMHDDDKVTSRGGAFWDAVGGGYWDAAADIAAASRSTFNPAWEHEDDFLHVWFVMSRYFRRPAATKREQKALLDRWSVVLDGAHDPRRDLCDALLRGDAAGFRAAFADVADAREADVRAQIAALTLSDEHAAWYLPFWGEGLALLRLAERDGLATDEHCRMVPQICRVPCPFAYDADAWRRIDFTPRRV
jgi:hypothetical protein